MDYLQNLGLMGLSSRLKRLSDDLTTDMNALYKSQGHDLESSVFPLLMLLYQEGDMCLRKAQNYLGSSHAHISQKAKALKTKKLIALKVDPADKRSKIMALTPQGKEMIATASPLWRAMNEALAEIFSHLDQRLLMALESAEERVADKPLYQTTMNRLGDEAVGEGKPKRAASYETK